MYGEKSFLSDDDLVESELISEEVSGSVAFDYEKVRDIDTLDCRDLLLRKRRSEERRDKFCLDRVFITGIPQEEAGDIILLKILPFVLFGGKFARKIPWLDFLCVVKVQCLEVVEK